MKVNKEGLEKLMVPKGACPISIIIGRYGIPGDKKKAFLLSEEVVSQILLGERRKDIRVYRNTIWIEWLNDKATEEEMYLTRMDTPEMYLLTEMKYNGSWVFCDVNEENAENYDFVYVKME